MTPDLDITAAPPAPPDCRNITGLRGSLRCAELLAQHTTWRVGGPARRLYVPSDAEDLAFFLRTLPGDEPLLWLGLGSNLLVRDGGFPGTVISTCGMLQAITPLDERTLRLEAGVPCPKAARAAAHLGMSGIEFLAGIPGTTGGALAGNAGAFGGEIWDRVLAVETLDRRGKRRLREPPAYRIRYREVTGPPGEWFIAAHFRLVPGAGAEAARRIKALLRQRNETQPLGLPSAGSVFRNPPGGHAARLIERCGLKGARVGGASVSEKHANFIINRGRATAADIELLMGEVANIVERVHGVRLVPEVRVVGDAGVRGL